jgi:sortase A
MRDKRPVDELSIEELERILAIKKREARMARLRTHEGSARRLPAPPPIEPVERVAPEQAPVPTETRPTPPTPPPSPAVPVVAFEDDLPSFEDELDAQRARRLRPASPPPTNPRKRAALWWNRALTVVEIAAVMGLVALLVNLFQSFQSVQQKTASLQAELEATRRAGFVEPTATPLISTGAVVLPTGHTFNNGEAVFNLEEVPAQYRDQVASFVAQIPAVRPTPRPEGPVRVQIPRLNIDQAVVYGDDWEALKLGVGHHVGSANPGERGNVVLSAHNDIYGSIFQHLDRLQPGDEITVYTWTKAYTYVVQPQEERGVVKGYRVVLPTDVWVLQPVGDQARLTLISCYPYRVNTKRIVVFATLKQ